MPRPRQPCLPRVSPLPSTPKPSRWSLSRRYRRQRHHPCACHCSVARTMSRATPRARAAPTCRMRFVMISSVSSFLQTKRCRTSGGGGRNCARERKADGARTAIMIQTRGTRSDITRPRGRAEETAGLRCRGPGTPPRDLAQRTLWKVASAHTSSLAYSTVPHARPAPSSTPASAF